MSAVIYVMNVVLLSRISHGLQTLWKIRHAFCLGLSLKISPFGPAICISNGTAPDISCLVFLLGGLQNAPNTCLTGMPWLLLPLLDHYSMLLGLQLLTGSSDCLD